LLKVNDRPKESAVRPLKVEFSARAPIIFEKSALKSAENSIFSGARAEN
jgi:hypothetical protein